MKAILVLFPEGIDNTDLEDVVDYIQDTDSPTGNPFNARILDVELWLKQCSFHTRGIQISIPEPITWVED